MPETLSSHLPKILFVTSYPPRECGIASYSQDLIKALSNKFNNSFSSAICALESEKEIHAYPEEVEFVLDTSSRDSYTQTAAEINEREDIRLVMIQHEFGLFDTSLEEDFLKFLSDITKPVIITYHTVLPNPDKDFKLKVERLSAGCNSIIVMTQNANDILARDYLIPKNKISVIPHGVHLVPHSDKNFLKEKFGLSGRTVLSTFGLISSGKSIETSIQALPEIVFQNSEVLFLIIGKTHPSVVKREGEIYREKLKALVQELGVQNYVKFINYYLPLPELLEYLQLTDIYLFTSRDPNQAVSGTFSYAISCGCPIVSTPIPHAKEVLKDDAGIIFDFQNHEQLAQAVNLLLKDEELKTSYSNNGLQRIVSSAWENVSLSHAALFIKACKALSFQFKIPAINLDHTKRLTTSVGIIQFSKIEQPDIDSGYTIDDNARALVAMVMHYELTRDEEDIPYIKTYLNFINYCQQPDGNFLNYVDEHEGFTEQNGETNLEDSNGRTLWALGNLISCRSILPQELTVLANAIFDKALPQIEAMHSSRAMAFALKGLYYYNLNREIIAHTVLVDTLAKRLVQMFKHEGELEWEWFESYLTYGNSILPEALLCAYQLINNPVYKEIAQASLAFLLGKTFAKNEIKVISNQNWLQRGGEAAQYGEQPIDVAYTIFALDRFYRVFGDDDYLHKMHIAFNWFLGRNHLHQIIYNPCTGGCYDGLEQYQINLNQGAESTVSYLMARLTVDKYYTEEPLSADLLLPEEMPV